MRCGEGFIICYSITDRHSLNKAVEYKNLITKVRASEDVPVILVGNTDAMHVDDVFHTLVREIRKRDEEQYYKEKSAPTSPWKKILEQPHQQYMRGKKHQHLSFSHPHFVCFSKGIFRPKNDILPTNLHTDNYYI